MEFSPKKSKGKCQVCKIICRTKCSNCRIIFYCCVDHQKKDREDHKKICSIILPAGFDFIRVMNSYFPDKSDDKSLADKVMKSCCLARSISIKTNDLKHQVQRFLEIKKIWNASMEKELNKVLESFPKEILTLDKIIDLRKFIENKSNGVSHDMGCAIILALEPTRLKVKKFWEENEISF